MNLTDALIIPGFSEREDDRYRRIASAFRGIGATPVFVPIVWPRTVITQNVEQFRPVYARYDPATTVVFGYSLGAMVAYMAARERSPAALILASVAPWFAEDVPERSHYHTRVIGSRRLSVYRGITFDDGAHRVTSRTTILVGEREIKQWPIFLTRARAVHAAISGSDLITVPRARHEIGHPKYMRAIERAIAGLA